MSLRHASCCPAVILLLGLAGCQPDSEPTSPSATPSFASTSRTIGVNVILKAPATAANRTELAKYGTLLDEIPQLNAIRVRTKASQLQAIRALPFVASASPDAVRHARP